MLTTNIKFKNFKIKKKTINIKRELISLLNENNHVINSLSKYYKNSFNKKTLFKYKKFSNYRIIGMGGSILGTQAIYDFLNSKIKKNFCFINNLCSFKKKKCN